MAPNRLLATSIIGFVLSRLGWVAPALVALLAAWGSRAALGGSIIYVLLPWMAVFAGLTIYAVVCAHARTRRCDPELKEI
jgi:hypothetical protein